jgi:hypothetical protein
MTRRATWAGLLATALLAACAPAALAEGEDAAGLSDETVTVTQTAESQDTCHEPDLFNPLSAFGDVRDYFVAPGGDFETAGDGWRLDGGAEIVGGGGSLAGGVGNSLRLPPGSEAVSPAFCVDLHYPTFRFFAAQLARRGGSLNVDVIYPELRKRNVHGAGDMNSNPHWRLSKDFKLEPQRAGKKAGWRKVAIRLRADATEGDWRVDDILIDPRMRG